MKLILSLIFCGCLFYTSPARALEMCWIFGNNMILQADRPLPVWGQGTPGEVVTVRFGGQEKTATVNDDGEWKVVLDAMPANGQGQTFNVTAASGVKEFSDVLLGDVWICSGQSNMAQPPAEKSQGAEAFAANLPNPLFRVYPVAYNEWAAEPDTRQFGWARKVSNWFDWIPASLNTAGVPFFFGEMLQRETGRPVGLIISPVGASNAECWIPMKDLEADPHFADIVEASKRFIAGAPEAREKFRQEIEAWEARKKEAEAQGQTFTEKRPNDMRPELAPRWWVGALHNARIAPLRNLAIKGVVWYQGENNAAGMGVCAKDVESYARLMKNIVASWRRQFEQPELPFFQVQLSMFNWNDFGGRQPRDANKPGSWSLIREAQEISSREIPHSGLAVSWDIGEKDNIHPDNKRPVGERLARLALRDVYGRSDVIADGPRYQSHKIEDGKMRIRFGNTHGGLKATGDAPKGFAVAGEDRRFVWAEAMIDGDDVLVWSGQVPNPVAARFAYVQFQDTDLFNDAGLPAVPFRTDDWPLQDGQAKD